LEIQGELNKYVITFARRSGQEWSITIVPRFSRQFVEERCDWKDALLLMPAEAPQHWTNAITGKNVNIRGCLSLKEIFQHFPAVLLVSASPAAIFLTSEV
jgi:maltooligosyltrehalose synthase